MEFILIIFKPIDLLTGSGVRITTNMRLLVQFEAFPPWKFFKRIRSETRSFESHKCNWVAIDGELANLTKELDINMFRAA